MAVRRPSMVCLSCQARRPPAAPRRPPVSMHLQQLSRLQTTAALCDDNDSFTPDALWRTKESRLKVLERLSNPWPSRSSGRQDRVPKSSHHHHRAEDAPIPHAEFRAQLRAAQALDAPKVVRQILRKQLLHCYQLSQLLRIVAAAMQTRNVAKHLAVQTDAIARAVYRCRETATDLEVLKRLDVIINRFRGAGCPSERKLLALALKFAARARSLSFMKKYLRIMREQGLDMTAELFRSIVAKFSIGYNGLGEIRNGRWKRHELLQVLTGFADAWHLPEQQKYHLGSFLVREDWQFLHGWVAALARCKDHESVWQEWEVWKQSPARRRPRQLIISEGRVTSKIRGDYWFIEQMASTGHVERAWTIFRETGIQFQTLKTRVKDTLLEGIEHVGEWNEAIRAEMVQKYDRDLAKIERAFGVAWKAGTEDGSGCHELVEDQEEALDRLGDPSWQLSLHYGYPDDEDDPIVSDSDRPLQHAPEKGRTL